MAAAEPRSEPSRRRARRGSVERPVNAGLVRVSLLLLVPAILLTSFTVARPGPLPIPALPPSFDGAAAGALATELARDHPIRVPGTPGGWEAARWYAQKLASNGLRVQEDSWQQEVPGLGRVRLTNLVTVVPGTTDGVIMFVAHRDNNGSSPGANRNASGTAALIELARGYATLGTIGRRPRPLHTLVFLSSDGGAYGGFGAERFASVSPLRRALRAVVSLDGLAGRGRPRLEFSSFVPSSPAPALLRTASARIGEQAGGMPERPSWLTQLIDLGLPLGYGEQAPFLRRRISAVRLTTEPSGTNLPDTSERLDLQRFAQLGRGAESLLASLDAGVDLAGATAPAVYAGDSVVRGWALELLLLAALAPFLIGLVDLLARCRRRGLALGEAWLVFRTRLGLWLGLGAVLGVGAALDLLPRGSVLPPPATPGLSRWPAGGVVLLAAAAAAVWWLGRRALAARRPAAAGEELAAYVVSFLVLGLVALFTALVNPFSLLFVLPSLYSWLWLPQTSSAWGRGVLYVLGLTGPLLALVSAAAQLGLGAASPLYLADLITLGLVPWPATVALLVWAAVAGQLAALAAGRYAARQSGR